MNRIAYRQGRAYAPFERIDDPPTFSVSHPAELIDEGATAMVVVAVSYRILNALLELGHTLRSVDIGRPPFGPL